MHRNAIYVLLLTVAGLTALGIVMLFSTGAFAPESNGDIYYFVKRQGMWLGIAAWALSWRRASTTTGGGRRGGYFLPYRSFFCCSASCRRSGKRSTARAAGSTWEISTFQPSELAKIAALFFLAWWFTRHEDKTETFSRPLLSARHLGSAGAAHPLLKSTLARAR